jgi:uncharacterized membrane protein
MKFTDLTDEQVEGLIGQVLRIGTTISCGITFIGLCIFMVHNASAIPHYHIFLSSLGQFYGPSLLLQHVMHGQAAALIQLGILILIATPVARVAFLVVAFALERDHMYVGVSALVLVILLYSIFFSQ